MVGADTEGAGPAPLLPPGSLEGNSSDPVRFPDWDGPRAAHRTHPTRAFPAKRGFLGSPAPRGAVRTSALTRPSEHPLQALAAGQGAATQP